MCLLDLASWLSLYTGSLSACAPCALIFSCQGVSQAFKDGGINLLALEVRHSRRQSSHVNSEAANVNEDLEHAIDTTGPVLNSIHAFYLRLSLLTVFVWTCMFVTFIS